VFGLSPEFGLGELFGLNPTLLGLVTPALGLENPELGLETPELGLETPELGLGTPELGLETPALGLETPALGLETPELGLEPALDPKLVPRVPSTLGLMPAGLFCLGALLGLLDLNPSLAPFGRDTPPLPNPPLETGTLGRNPLLAETWLGLNPVGLGEN
jgi:hypothetical protein